MDDGYLPARKDVLHTRSPKAAAIWRLEFLPLWQGARSVLRLLIMRGRGKRFRSWLYTTNMAKLLPRSGIVEHYSVEHVRRVLVLLQKYGLIRWVEVPQGGSFPASAAPDVDGGGKLCPCGGKVYEVNVDALLGRAPVWMPPERALPVGRPSLAEIEETWAAEERAEAEGVTEDDREALAELAGSASSAPPVAVAELAPLTRPMLIHGEGGSDHADRHRSDLGSPTENNSRDPEREALGPPSGGLRDDAASPREDSHADAGGRSAHAGASRAGSARHDGRRDPRDLTARAAPSRATTKGEHDPRQASPPAPREPTTHPPATFGPAAETRQRLRELGLWFGPNEPGSPHGRR